MFFGYIDMVFNPPFHYQAGHRPLVVLVGARDLNRQRGTSLVDQQVDLGAQFGAIGQMPFSTARLATRGRPGRRSFGSCDKCRFTLRQRLRGTRW